MEWRFILNQRINNLIRKLEVEFVHYAFLDKYEFGWEKKVHRMASGYQELKRNGLI